MNNVRVGCRVHDDDPLYVTFLHLFTVDDAL